MLRPSQYHVYWTQENFITKVETKALGAFINEVRERNMLLRIAFEVNRTTRAFVKVSKNNYGEEISL